jgi:propionyl-CoA synthetase
MSRYHAVYETWKQNPEGFWAEAATALDWFKPWDRVQDSSSGLDRWFAGATCNTCFNAVDRHVAAGHGERVAVIFDSAMTGDKRHITYGQLQAETARLGAALQGLGVAKGDRVILYMPMVPEALVGMLACARIGAVHSVVFGGFAPAELATRITDAKPRVILTASCGLEPNRVLAYKPLVDEAIALSTHKPQHVVLLQRPQLEAGGVAADARVTQHDWQQLVAAQTGLSDCVPVAATDPLYILYTSGTTGRPRVLCATMVGIWSPCTGAWKTFTPSSQARCSGQLPMWAGWWGTLILSMRRFLRVPRR